MVVRRAVEPFFPLTEYVHENDIGLIGHVGWLSDSRRRTRKHPFGFAAPEPHRGGEGASRPSKR